MKHAGARAACGLWQDHVLISPGLATMLHMLHPLTDVVFASIAVKGFEDSEVICECRRCWRNGSSITWDLAQNYRGAHLTTILSKVVERLVAHTVFLFLEATSAFGHSQ